MKSKLWLKKWNASIGGSRAAAVVGKSPWQTSLDVYRQMRGEQPMPDLSDNPDVRRGVTFEAPMRKLLAKEIGQKIAPHPQYTFLHNDDYPHAHTLVDGWVGGKGQMPLELKLPRPQNVTRIAMEGLPETYLIQAQHELAVTNKPKLLFVVGCVVTMRLIVQEIVADQSFIDELMRAESEFYGRVIRGEPPAVGEVSALPAPAAPPPVDGIIVKLDSIDAIKAAQAYVEAQELQGEVEELKEAAKQRLLAVAGGAEVFQISDGNGLACRFYARTQDGRKTFDAKAAIASDPKLERFYRVGEPYQTFRMYQLNNNGKAE